jgi:geranylgeranyl pyrophosphate synthase
MIRMCMGIKYLMFLAVILSDMFVNKINSKVVQIGGLIEYLHTASLIIDDIEDGSILRREEKCSHLVFGLDRSINAANLMYFLPFQRLLKGFEGPEEKFKILEAFTE